MRNIDMLEGLPREAIYAILDRADKLIEEEATAYLVANKVWHRCGPGGGIRELTDSLTEERREKARKQMAIG